MITEKNEFKPSGNFKLLQRVTALRSDQRGSMTLLMGMMVFLVTIFAIIAFDTNKAIYNRIIAQNAVDSAADAAALWQARGCNMLQQLNNLHYDVDEGLCIAEGVSASACVAAEALYAAELAGDAFFGAGEALRPVRYAVCLFCDPLPWIDYVQQMFYKAIMPIQQGIVEATPYLAFGYANACAKGSGADTLGSAMGDTLQSLLSHLGINVPGLDSLGGVVGSIPIYAVPLDPDSFGLFDPKNKGLYVKKRNNDGSPPLNWPAVVGEIGDQAGYVGCSDAVPVTYPQSREAAKAMSWDSKWGWDDQYYFGHPGFMTWIAGKQGQQELLGLGDLRWLNGGSAAASGETDYGMGQSNLRMYTGSATGSDGSPLTIPGFIAIASSQVEGAPVICHGGVDAQGKLIKVYIPSGGSPKPAEDYFIFH